MRTRNSFGGVVSPAGADAEAPLRRLGIATLLLGALAASIWIWAHVLWDGSSEKTALTPRRLTPAGQDVPTPVVSEPRDPVRPRRAATSPAIADSPGETGAPAEAEASDEALASIGVSDLPAMLAHLMTLPGRAPAELRSRLVRRWAEADAPAAAAWVSSHAANDADRQTLEQVAFAWAAKDLTAAARWAQELPAGEAQAAATLALSYEAARTLPQRALELAAPLPKSSERDQLLVHALSQWAAADPAAATDWGLGVADVPLRRRLLASVATAAAVTQPAAAATLAAQQTAPGDEQERSAVSVIQRWAQVAPAEAAAWLAQFPPGTARLAATESLAALWTTQDTQAAAAWVNSLPAGPQQEVAQAAFNRAAARTDRIIEPDSPPEDAAP